MTAQRDAKKPHKALHRRRRNAQERQQHQQRQAQRDIEALRHARDDLGVPDHLVLEIAGRLSAHKQRLGTLVGRMFPTLFGCRSADALPGVRGGDTHMPSPLLSALPTRSWLTRLRQRALDVLTPLWRHIPSLSPATRSRWQWTGVWDAAVLRTDGQDVARVGHCDSGQHQRVVSGIDGVRLRVVVGDGTRVVPVDCAVRRPDPTGPGARCRHTLEWAHVLLDPRVAALTRRGVRLPAPRAAAERWLSDSPLMRHVRATPQGTVLVQGQSSSVFTLADGHKVKGADRMTGDQWPWRHRLPAPGCRSVRLRATSATSGEVTLILVDNDGEERFDVFCVASERPATRFLHVWSRRHLSEQVFRVLKQVLATAACHVHRDAAYYGHLVRRLMASFVRYYTSRVLCKGRGTMDERIFHVKHHWSSVDCQDLAL